MGKLSNDDKMRIQTLREQGLGAKAIKSLYPTKGWKLSTVSYICKKIDETGSATTRRAGSGRPKTSRSESNIEAVGTMICSQENEPGTSKSTRQIAGQLNISRESVRLIAKRDLKFSSFKRVPVQIINEATRLKRLSRTKKLLKRLTVAKTKRVFFYR